MIQPNSTNKNDSEAKAGKSSVDKSKCYLVKGSKPLQKYRFYLDIKNHAVTNKLEQKVKDLGGVVEFFLVREVTHVISDRQECSGFANSPQTPLGASVESNYPNESPKPETPRAGQTRLKTRADAMLEKVRSQSVTPVRDPLRNAKLWNIPIWTVNKVFAWLEKVSKNLALGSGGSRTSAAKQLLIQAPYLKLEAISRDARPVYKALDHWPELDFDAPPGKPAFCMKARDREPDEERMTRKGRPRLSVRGSIKDTEEKPHQEKILGGYCEICHTEYRELNEHLRSDGHLQFVRNDANFLTLDSLIGATGNVEAFLRLNGASPKDGLRRSLRNGRSPNGKVNGVEECCRTLRSKMYNTRYSSNHSALSPTGSDGGHHLRSRGITAEDEVCPNKPKESARQERKNSRLSEDETKHKEFERETRSKESDRETRQKDSDRETRYIGSDREMRHRESDQETRHKESDRETRHRDSDTKHKESDRETRHNEREKNRENEEKKLLEHGKSKRTCIKTKRISADERLVADNKTYYKVEVMTTKLRSSGLGNREHELTRRTHTPIPEEEEEEEPSLVVKFKRVRRSELSVLNDEAENFMFPRKEDSSYGDIDTDEGPNTTLSSSNKNDSMDLPSSEIESHKTPAKLFSSEPSEDSVEEYLDSIALSKLQKCETDIVNKRKTRSTDVELDETPKTVPSIRSESLRRRSARKSECHPVLEEALDDTAQDGSVMCEVNTRRKRKSEVVEYVEENDASMDGTSRDSGAVSVCDSESRRGKKRRTQAEAFIEDNQKYFKFETPGSRLRYQGTLFGSAIKSPTRNNGEQQEEKKHDENSRPEFSLKDIKFSFEIEPKSEPWYQTFQRQDRGEEHYTSFSDPGYQTRLILPYQLPAHFIPLDPQVCISHYEKIKNYLMKPEDEEDEEEEEDEQPSTSAETSESTAPPENPPSKMDLHHRRRKRKNRFMMKSNHPRKSPRQHASTLAILSSLIHQRKKREKKHGRESDVSQSSLGAITEEESPPPTPTPVETMPVEIEENDDDSAACQLISEILSAPMDDIDVEGEIEGIFLKDTPDAIELIQNYNVVEKKSSNYQTPGLSETTRIIRRKRKKNRTGWPKKKRLFPRRPGLKTDEVVLQAEAEDSRLTEGSLDGEADVTKESDAEEVANDDASDVENRTISEFALNTDSVDSNCNLNDTEKKCDVKSEPTESDKLKSEVQKTKSELVDMINDSSEDIFVYDNLKQGVTHCLIKNDTINRLADKTNCALVKNEEKDDTKSEESQLNTSQENEKSPVKKEQRNSSSENPAEEVVASSEDKDEDCVNVDLNTWENAEKVLHAKMADNEQVRTNKILQYQPFVRVQKIDTKIQAHRRLRSSSSPERKRKAKKPRLSQPVSPRSPRKLRTPRGKWYRER